MKPIRVWLAVDKDGSAYLYRDRPTYDAHYEEWRLAKHYGGYFRCGEMKSLAGQCIEADVVLKDSTSGWVPPCTDRDDEVALRKHEKEKFL